jgi:hypothetical protein
MLNNKNGKFKRFWNLFKKTISTLQGQLQERSIQISRLETNHIDPQYEKQISDLNHTIEQQNINYNNLFQDFNQV